jgi:hypothetical protein
MPAAYVRDRYGDRQPVTPATAHLKGIADDLSALAALPDSSAWFGGESPASKPLLEHLSKGKWHSNSLPGPVGSFVGTVSATSDSNVWLDESGATAAVGHLTKHGWATRSFAVGTDDVLMDTLVTTGPKNTWVLDYDFTTKIAYAYHNTGSASWSASPCRPTPARTPRSPRRRPATSGWSGTSARPVPGRRCATTARSGR